MVTTIAYRCWSCFTDQPPRSRTFGARFLAATLTQARRGAIRPLKILVATSGDTGGAVAAAFHGHSGIEVAVLYPKGLVSPTQEQQLTCWGDNVVSLAVRGRFDDCQRMVKAALGDTTLRRRFELSSANSINLGRLLPQMVYYWAASLAIRRLHGEPASFVIPSGNLGNATACVWARRLGAPIDSIVLAHNANRTVPDYFAQGVLRPRASVATHVVCHGRRQPEQSGAAGGAVSGPGRDAYRAARGLDRR